MSAADNYFDKYHIYQRYRDKGQLNPWLPECPVKFSQRDCR